MSDLDDLLQRLAAAEGAAESRRFLAPCVPGARLRRRVSSLVHTYRPDPADFTGWGWFLPADERTAMLEEEASLPDVARYLEALPSLRVWLARVLVGRSWLAVPANASDARQRFGSSAPIAVRLVEGASSLDRVVARHDSASWWFDEPDRRADPILSAQLRERLADISAEALRQPGLTPEQRLAYRLAREPLVEPPAPPPPARRHGRVAPRRQRSESRAPEPGQDGRRLTEALAQAGGRLVDYQDRGDFWWVEWRTATGERHTSAIAKQNLTVVTAGICLDGTDNMFDLQSLVGVVEGRWED